MKKHITVQRVEVSRYKNEGNEMEDYGTNVDRVTDGFLLTENKQG